MFNWLEFSQSCARGLLIGLNVLFIFIAACTFSCAAVDLTLLAQYGEEAGGSITADIVIIVASLFLVLLATLGCVGAGKNNEKIIYTYLMFLAGFSLLEALICIFVSIQRFGLQYRVTDWLRDDFYSNTTNLELWDKLQSYYQCCGLNGPEDYEALNRSISLSCCQRAQLARNNIAQKNMYRSCIKSQSYFSEGCEDQIMSVLQGDADFLFGAAVVSFWIEACSMLLALLVTRHIKNSVQVYKHTVKY